MKDYIYQFYNEGLATTFYLKPIKFINKFIKNSFALNTIQILITVLYTALVLMFSWYMFWEKYPL